eukprot:18312-Heterococcus_DN1.PRE.1
MMGHSDMACSRVCTDHAISLYDPWNPSNRQRLNMQAALMLSYTQTDYSCSHYHYTIQASCI